ncbi:hypothetical protein VE04_10288 [Pseudogymnoascus sp. 24MN13]|nr:hypothetical protein VE04_10288 [Pseudogymnoascus sp. 24MN13]
MGPDSLIADFDYSLCEELPELQSTYIINNTSLIKNEALPPHSLSSLILAITATPYYSNGANSQNGEQPDDTCYPDLSGYVNWEGNAVSGTFSGGTTFTSHIDSTAQSRALYSYSGWGTNTYHNFNCYKDNYRLLYSFGSYPVKCYSIYYCLPA